jgi:predicted ATPase
VGELLERDDLLHLLCGHLHDAAAGAGRLVLIRGEAGVGKTAVVRRLATFAGSTARILVGACDPLSTPRPLGPLVDVAADLGQGLAEALERALHGSRSVSGVFQRLLAELQTEPVVVVFEDVHWADEATLDLLRYLARRIDRTRALLVATYRDDELGATHPLAVMLEDVATCPAVHRWAVGPLSRQAVARLVAGRRVDLDQLFRVTGGNPFFVTEFLATDGEGIPGTVREAVTGRLARLSAPTRAVAETLAVIGAAAPPELLAVLVPDAEAALEEALDGGLVHVDGALIAFRHELARMAVYDTIPAPRRARLHGQVLTALRSGVVARNSPNSRNSPDSVNSPARLAAHAEEARDVEAVCTYAVTAATQAMALRAHREAAAVRARAAVRRCPARRTAARPARRPVVRALLHRANERGNRRA